MREALLAILTLAAASSAFAQSENLLGSKVVTKYATPLKVDDKVVDADDVHRIYIVKKVDGNRVWLVAGSVAGWVESSAVVPLESAIDFYTQEIARRPSQPAAFRQRGLAWADRGEFDNAIADYSEAIRLNPDDAVTHNNRGNAWRDKEEYERAIADYGEAIRLDPKYWLPYRNRGFAWDEIGESEKALDDYRQAIRLNPRDEVAYNDRGFLWIGQQEYDKAILDLNEAIRLDPTYAYAYNNRGLAWKNKEEYDKAIADYSEAIRLAPKFVWPLLNRAFVWTEKAEYRKSVADYDAAISLEPQEAGAYNAKAWLLAACPEEGIRDGKEAVILATKACELHDWMDADSLDTLAAAFAERGDFGLAMAMQAKANALFTDEQDREEGSRRIALYRRRKPFRFAP